MSGDDTLVKGLTVSGWSFYQNTNKLTVNAQAFRDPIHAIANFYLASVHASYLTPRLGIKITRQFLTLGDIFSDTRTRYSASLRVWHRSSYIELLYCHQRDVSEAPRTGLA